MKNKFFIIILLGFVAQLTMAAPVSPQRAMQVAQQFVPVSESAVLAPNRISDTSAIVYTHPMPKSGEPAFYIVNVDGAFVLVSADDIARPILGYNFGKNWPTDMTELPAHVKSFFDDLAAQMEAAKEAEPNRAPAAEWTRANQSPQRRAMADLPDSVGPLLTTTWGQGQYYNALCPEDQNASYGNDGHCPTGCVATAMAQIINYWGYPTHGRGTHSYETNYGTLTINYDSAHYDFVHMPTALTNSSTQQEIQAVATLIRDCGIATNMNYGTIESGANVYDARAGLINFFQYSPNLSMAIRDNYGDIEWFNLLRENLAANHPIIYGGQGNGNHTFVCDGYNSNGFFHFNMGWGGSFNGWYLVSSILPGSYDFSSSQTALVGIEPDSTGNIILGQTYGRSTFEVNEPIELYHTLGHNAYPLLNYSNTCNNTIIFTLSDTTSQFVVDILSYENQNLSIYDGSTGAVLRTLNSGTTNYSTPIVSSSHSIRVEYQGNMHRNGFQMRIGKDDGCRRVSNVIASVDTTTVHLTWTENGTATSWEVEYGEKGFEHGDGTIVISNDTTLDLMGLKSFRDYDVYVRSLCDDAEKGLWSPKITVMPEARYWTDVVKSQPEGYVEDSLGNAYISSAEGLAWFSKCAGTDNNYFRGRKATITADINLGKYKWRPVWSFSGVLDGQGHQIDSMFCCIALFDWATNATIKNINLTNCYSYLAGLVSEAWNNDTIMNCFVSGRIGDGSNSEVGGIVGYASGRNGSQVHIYNCVSNCNITASKEAGGIVGKGYSFLITNCYSASTVHVSTNFSGAILGYAENCRVENCYGFMPRNGNLKIADGAKSTYINNTFFNETDSGFYLNKPMFFEPDSMYYTSLIDALNACVRRYNIEGLRIWEEDTIRMNEGMPVLGSHYEVTCPNVKNFTLKNIVDSNGLYGVELSWIEVGEATTWGIKYYKKGTTDEVRLVTTNNPDTIWGLEESTTYVFSVRPICNAENKGGWCDEVTFVVDRPYWTEIVTAQPEGYSTDGMGNISISSADGLAWLISVANGLNGETAQNLAGKKVTLTQDVDISMYKWTAIQDFEGIFDGENHTIHGLYVNELENDQGLFGKIESGVCMNVIIDNAYVSGKDLVGILVGGVYSKSSIINCHVSGIVYGENYAGGLIGRTYNSLLVDKCSSSGQVEAKYDNAGGLIGYTGGNFYDENWVFGHGCVRNSFSTCEVKAGRYSCGGLIGDATDDIENCYAIGNVNGRLYNGGLAGAFTAVSKTPQSSAMKNSYACGSVSPTSYLSINGYLGYRYGTITGTTARTPLISYCYGLTTPAKPILVGASDNGSYPVIDNMVSLVRNTDDILLQNNIVINDSTYTTLLSALNAWVDANDTAGIYYHWVADTAIVNGGFPIFAQMEETGPTTRIDECGSSSERPVRKVLHNGHLYILLPDGTRYSTTGKKVQ